MKREITYTWRARELMARNGITSAQALTDLLLERGITLSRSQVWRLVAQDPERISFAVLGALCDILGVEPSDFGGWSPRTPNGSRSPSSALSAISSGSSPAS
ncbi:helix-turn-helix transcriptional regulator [Paenarthrobacter sp. PH39-S1]|uniref:helix-turn-helix domain-containing protein n=1 Tax=Paenarthrobacter sp. PH39-S1 TaxID=3046204 RepID=UPI0024BA0F1C|nr:helix-turn-helix transcriptional regulator [Paenarthrobacter sp. PH39-S1]MDJ0358131.1 helix-turn-helix transcriptional regulator [Paenarthrobacter sp. PH39-S1]